MRAAQFLMIVFGLALCLFAEVSTAYESTINDVKLELSGVVNLRGEGNRVRRRAKLTTDHSAKFTNVLVVNGKVSTENHQIVTQIRPYIYVKMDPSSYNYSNVSVDELYWDVKLTDTLTTTLGRRQLVNGVALGYNPTDFLSNTKQVTRNNLTDTERRSERKGDNLVGVSKYFSESSLQGYVLAPNSPEVDHVRGLLMFSDRIQALQTDYILSAYYDDELQVGLNISSTLSHSLTGYLEVAVRQKRGRKEDDGGVETNDNTLKLENYDAVLGLQYTHESGVGLNVEYWRSNTAYSTSEINDIWDHVGVGLVAPDDAEKMLSDNNNLQQEKVFVRVSDIPLFEDVTLEQTGIVGLNDNSLFLRTALAWQATEESTVRLNLSHFSGKKKSEFGMIPYEWQLFSSYKHHF